MRKSTEKYEGKRSPVVRPWKMSARRVGQHVFDWVRIASRVPEEAKADFSAFRARHEACKAA